MRRTKIVCTMGPNTNSRDLMKKLIETGMDVLVLIFLMETTMSRKCVWIC